MSSYSTFESLKIYENVPVIGEKLWVVTDANGGPTTLSNGVYIKTGLTYLQTDYPDLFRALGHTGGTWYYTQRTSGTTSTIFSMCYGNGLYVYAGAGGITGTSTDAITWTAITSVASSSGTPVDYSPTQKTVTLNGSAALSTVQSKFGGYSLSLSGTNSYMTVTRSTDMIPVANEDFTFEAWIYMTAAPSAVQGAQIMGFHDYGTASDWVFAIGNTGIFGLYIQSVATSYNNNSQPVSLNQWTHVAVARSGTGANNLKFFRNGVLGDTYSVNSTLLATGGYNLSIGADRVGDVAFTGYIDDVRITKGVARYTTNFTPPTTANPDSVADPYYSNVSLLLKMDPSKLFFDLSQNANTLTVAGNVRESTSTYKSGTSSINFNGTTNTYLSFPISTDFNFGTNDFTIEAWIYFNSITGVRPVFSVDTSSYPAILIQSESGTLKAYATSASTSWDILNGATFGSVIAGQWYHIALTRSGSTFKTFLDGITITTINSSSAIENQNGTGRIGTSDISSNLMSGYIDDLRVTKGVARYTSNFTPVNDFYSADPYYSNTVLIIDGDDGVNASTTFIDKSQSPKTITAVSGAKISTSVKKYGTGSISFNGTTDYLEIPDNDIFTFSADFTIEAWIYPTSLSGILRPICAHWPGAIATNCSWYFTLTPSGYLRLRYGVSSLNADITGTTQTVSLNTWSHVAVTRSGNTVRFFVNGNLDSTTGTISGSLNNSPSTVRIGSINTSNDPYYFEGYIDDLRITNGVARYISNFTPPTPHFSGNDQYYSNTSLLINGQPINNITTTTSGSGTTNQINSIVYGNQLYLYGANAGALGSSANGSTWTARTSGTSSNITAVAYGNNTYVYGGAGGVLATSTDAITWTARTSGTSSQINSIIYVNNLWLYAGAGGALATSTDAITWIPRSSSTTVQIFNLTYANGMYWYSAASGQVGNSIDGIIWLNRNIGTTSGEVRSIIYGNGYFVAGGTASSTTNGTSIDGVTWTRKNVNDTDVFNVLFNNGLYVYAGASGRIRTTTDLFNATGGTTYNYNTEFAVPAVTTNNSLNLAGVTGGSARLVCYVRAKQ